MNVQKILQKYKEKESWRKTTKDNLQLVAAVMALSINSELGFGAKRINRIVKRMTDNMGFIAEGRITESDVYSWCKANNIDL